MGIEILFRRATNPPTRERSEVMIKICGEAARVAALTQDGNRHSKTPLICASSYTNGTRLYVPSRVEGVASNERSRTIALKNPRCSRLILGAPHALRSDIRRIERDTLVSALVERSERTWDVKQRRVESEKPAYRRIDYDGRALADLCTRPRMRCVRVDITGFRGASIEALLLSRSRRLHLACRPWVRRSSRGTALSPKGHRRNSDRQRKARATEPQHLSFGTGSTMTIRDIARDWLQRRYCSAPATNSWMNAMNHRGSYRNDGSERCVPLDEDLMMIQKEKTAAGSR